MGNSVAQMKAFLTENKNEKLNEFLKGKVDAKTLLNESGLPRHALYKALEVVKPDATEIRKYNIQKRKIEEANKLLEYIKNGIPFEYMKIDRGALLGYSTLYYKSADEKMVKVRLQNVLIEVLGDIDYTFCKFDYLTILIRRIEIVRSLSEGMTGFSVAKKYGVYPSNVYNIQKEFRETNRYVPEVSKEQERVLHRNIKLYKQYKNDGNKGELKGDISEEYFEVIIKVMTDVFKHIEK